MTVLPALFMTVSKAISMETEFAPKIASMKTASASLLKSSFGATPLEATTGFDCSTIQVLYKHQKPSLVRRLNE